MNKQPIEKARPGDGKLEVHSIFRTIQGEGPYTGHPAIFVRLAGCNLQCPLCDTDYTSTRDTLSFWAVGERVLALGKPKFGRPLVVVTGGEPFRQDLTELVTHLIGIGYRVQVETNGTLPIPAMLADLSPELFTVVVSPKASKVHPTVFSRADAWKYVMREGAVAPDGLPTSALDHSNGHGLARPPSGTMATEIYLQPCDQKDPTLNAANVQACVAQSIRNGYVLQIQTHKILGVE